LAGNRNRATTRRTAQTTRNRNTQTSRSQTSPSRVSTPETPIALSQHGQSRRDWIKYVVGGLVVGGAACATLGAYNLGSSRRDDGVSVSVNVDGKGFQPAQPTTIQPQTTQPIQPQQPQTYQPQNYNSDIFEDYYGLNRSKGLAELYNDLESCAANHRRFLANVIIDPSADNCLGDYNKSNADIWDNQHRFLFHLAAGYDSRREDFYVEKSGSGYCVRMYGADFERQFDRGGWGDWLHVKRVHIGTGYKGRDNSGY
jgi:hypothetical protein